MAPKPRAMTAKALQTLLVHIGAPSSGTKAVLQERFRRGIGIFHLSKSQPAWPRSRAANKKLRIMSIDMGIKNLAFCEAEISYPSKDSLDAEMKVLRWEKVNLTEAPGDEIQNEKESPRKVKTAKQSTADADEASDIYSADALSKTAYGLIKNTILAGSPDIILIEKQRWRSGGGSAVQQWTLRVNTLEGMLWAVLQTIHAQRLELGTSATTTAKLYEVFSADPKRVGQYWLTRAAGRLAEGDEDEAATPKKTLNRSKAEKKVKISLLRSWLTATPASTASVTQDTVPGITFSFAPDAENTREALLSISTSKRRKKARDESDDVLPAVAVAGSALKKLDDVTDCFLQAAAWVSWESNRLQLRQVWERNMSGDGDGEGLTDEVMLEMLEKIEGG
ncbi:mitochondrial resolvase Ydc2 [Alternaria rosae]|uniref:mitochondrial resolvase Ydc2 n=1 Tax=Alternaria rosae TaxID=1187941 RepID=UPI001E8ECA33|nr:mitochondrial resolvase Ydc2 [Alternaria rosae]KAH6875396.1 mitochondrial resolvase Ydc2 [Alternaria rosae]